MLWPLALLTCSMRAMTLTLMNRLLLISLNSRRYVVTKIVEIGRGHLFLIPRCTCSQCRCLELNLVHIVWLECSNCCPSITRLCVVILLYVDKVSEWQFKKVQDSCGHIQGLYYYFFLSSFWVLFLHIFIWVLFLHIFIWYCLLCEEGGSSVGESYLHWGPTGSAWLSWLLAGVHWDLLHEIGTQNVSRSITFHSLIPE